MAATEPPTERRIREARERGQVARSEVLAPAALLLAGLMALGLWGEQAWDETCAWLAARLGQVAQPELASQAFTGFEGSLAPWAWAAALACFGVVVVQRTQVGFVFAWRAPAGPPRPLLRGWLSGLLATLVLLGAVALAFDRALALHWLAPAAPAEEAVGLRAFAWAFGLGLPLFAAVDVVRSRAAYLRGLRMHRHELERERRETEGPRAPRQRQRRLLSGAPRQR